MEKRSEYWNWGHLITLSILFFANVVTAQQRPGPPEIPDSNKIVQMVNHLASDLALTKEQKAKILKMHLGHFKEVKKALKEFKGNMDQQKEKMDAKRDKFQKGIKSILTAEQVKKYEKFLKLHQGPQNKKKGNPDTRTGH